MQRGQEVRLVFGGSGEGDLQTLAKLFAFHEVLLLCGSSRQNQD